MIRYQTNWFPIEIPIGHGELGGLNGSHDTISFLRTYTYSFGGHPSRINIDKQFKCYKPDIDMISPLQQ